MLIQSFLVCHAWNILSSVLSRSSVHPHSYQMAEQHDLRRHVTWSSLSGGRRPINSHDRDAVGLLFLPLQENTNHGAFLYHGEARWCPSWSGGRDHQALRGPWLQTGVHEVYAREFWWFQEAGREQWPTSMNGRRTLAGGRVVMM